MDIELKMRLVQNLKLLERNRTSYVERLKSLNGAEHDMLKKSVRKEGSYYYVKRRGAKRYRYLGTDDNYEVMRIKQAHFLTSAIERIDRDIDLISSLLNNYLSTDYESICKDLPNAYGGIPLTDAMIYSTKAAEWRTEMLAFQAKFPENFPDNKRHTACDGTKIKTISEVSIYDRLYTSNLFPIYELPIPLEDHGPTIYPDFTVLSPIDLETHIIIEYVGMLDKPGYRESFAARVGRYLKNGYKIGVNLFFVYGDSEGRIDTTQLNVIIDQILGN